MELDGIFLSLAFLSYRKINDKTVLYFILIYITNIFAFIPMLFVGMKAKFYVIKRFELALDSGDVMFKAMSGKTTLLVWIIVGLSILTILFIAICIYFMGFDGFIEALFDIDRAQQNYHKYYSGS